MRIPKVGIWRVTWWNGKIKVAQVRVAAPTQYLARLCLMDALGEPSNSLQRQRWFSQRHAITRCTYYRERVQ